MFQRRIIFSERSYLEVSTRIHDGKDQVMLTLVGPKNKSETTASSVILPEGDLAMLIKHLQDALDRDPSWPSENNDKDSL